MSAVSERSIVDARIHRLASMARALGGSHRLFPMIEIAAEEAQLALGAATASISRIERGTGTLRTLINSGVLGPQEERWPEREIYQMADFVRLRDDDGDLRAWTVSIDNPSGFDEEVALLRSLHKGCSLSAPIMVDGSLWGELYATRFVDEAEFDTADMAYIEALSAILAGAVSRALHVETLERLAFFDPLTGLANRRALDEAAEQAFEVLADGALRPVTVVAVDVNGLKGVNDGGGHAHGDGFLIAVAASLTHHFALLDGSLVARVGGDEFSVLVPDHGVDRVLETANAMCEAVRALPWGSGVSCGVASTLGTTWRRPHQLFQAADKAQYEAKNSAAAFAVLAH